MISDWSVSVKLATETDIVFCQARDHASVEDGAAALWVKLGPREYLVAVANEYGTAFIHPHNAPGDMFDREKIEELFDLATSCLTPFI